MFPGSNEFNTEVHGDSLCVLAPEEIFLLCKGEDTAVRYLSGQVGCKCTKNERPWGISDLLCESGTPAARRQELGTALHLVPVAPRDVRCHWGSLFGILVCDMQGYLENEGGGGDRVAHNVACGV